MNECNVDGTMLCVVKNQVDPQPGLSVRTYEMKVHGMGQQLPPGWAWYKQASGNGLDWAQISGYRLAQETLAQRRRRCTDDGLPEYCNPGWWETATNWIQESTQALRLGSVTSVVQLRVWEYSTVLRVSTDRSDFYFKALPRGLEKEWKVTNYLSDYFATGVPRVIASDAERSWLLMEAVEGSELGPSVDLKHWERAAADYGALQAACVQHVDTLKMLGCQSRTLEQISDDIESLMADSSAMLPGQPAGRMSS